MNEIRILENEIAVLPKGSITRKVIQGKNRYYLQWREADKVKNRYVSAAELPTLSAQIERRKELQQKLIELQVSSIQKTIVGAGADQSPVEFLMGSFAAEKRAAYNVSPYESQDRMVNFFLSLNQGFCLEARARLLPLDGPDIRVDWIFYNRILHCHVLVNLKDGEFRKQDLDQLSSCVLYYRGHEMQPNDNPPVGILLSTTKGPKMVEFASVCIAKKDFNAVYKPKLPTKHQLLEFMERNDLLTGKKL